MNAAIGVSWPFFSIAPSRESSIQMRLWQGVLLSILFHFPLFFIPVDVGPTRELSSSFAEMQFVIEAASREGNSEEASITKQIDEQPSGPSAQPQPEKVVQPEEPRDSANAENEPPLPLDRSAPTMLAREIPRPPEPVKKPPKREQKPAKREKTVKAQLKPKTVSDSGPSPSQSPIQEPGAGSEPAGDGRQGSAVHSSPLGEGGPPNDGPVDSSFGSGDGPRFLSKTLPKYPRLARELGKEGTVLLRLTIDERGRLLRVELVKKAGSGFDEEAVRAVKSSTFSPAKKGGKPVLCRAQLPIRFVLRSNEND
jgi:protein TonB